MLNINIWIINVRSLKLPVNVLTTVLTYITAKATYYSLFLNLSLLLNAVTVLCLSIVAMIFLLVIPKYRYLFKSKIIPYCILAFYSTIIYFIGVLIHAIIFFDTD